MKKMIAGAFALAASTGLSATATINGHSAEVVYEAMFAADVEGVKTIRGEGAIECFYLNTGMPPGAVGIVAPMARCTAYPEVEFPDGALGIVAPWFTINGFSGYGLARALESISDNGPTLSGDLEIKCYQAEKECTFTKIEAEPLFTLELSAADSVKQQLERIYGPTVTGKGAISCTVRVPNPPDGAVGIFFPTATCAGYPIVDWPDGVVGIVAPWFTLNGLEGYQLYSALPGEPDENDTKTLTGDLKIECMDDDSETTICDFYEL